MIRTQDQAQNEKRLTFKSKRLQPKSVWLTAALFDITPRDRLSVVIICYGLGPSVGTWVLVIAHGT